MTAPPGPHCGNLETGTSSITHLGVRFVEDRARRERISQILRQNQIGPRRSLLGSLNEFRHWTPQEVTDLFDKYLPPIIQGSPDESRKLYPLGPLYRTIPADSRRWKELAAKAALVGAADILAISCSPLLLLASKEGRKKALKSMVDLNVSTISSSFFVKPDPALLEQAASSGKALCVNRWGTFRIMDSGYAAISHVWAETMGLEYNDEKTEHDERGFNMHHFIRIMDVASRTGSEWFWFDLLAIPKGDDPATKALKTQLINSLQRVYANAEKIIVLDSLTIQLNTGDPLITAATLSCGRWLSRVWRYQEAKLACKLAIVTATHVIDLEEMVAALREADNLDSNRWHLLYLTFYRLMPLHNRGITLADIAMSCDHRSCTNHIDYARGFFAVLGLKWQHGWTYEEGMLEILKSQPKHAARIAGMHGPRGLPSPYSWAPKYLAQLQGKNFGCFDAQLGSLIGYWHTVAVRSVQRKFVADTINETLRLSDIDSAKTWVYDLVVSATSGGRPMPETSPVSADIQIQFFPEHWTSELEMWVNETIPSGKGRLLCAEPMGLSSAQEDQHARVVLAVTDISGPISDLHLDGWGTVAGSAILNSPSIGVEDKKLRWNLT